MADRQSSSPADSKKAVCSERRHLSKEGASLERLLHILVADDEQAMLDVTCRLLRLAGYAVVPALTAEEALAQYQADPSRILLALIDLGIADMGGEVLVQELRRRAPELPIIVMSGHCDEEVLGRLANVRLAGCLQKPFRMPTLLEMLSRVTQV